MTKGEFKKRYYEKVYNPKFREPLTHSDWLSWIDEARKDIISKATEYPGLPAVKIVNLDDVLKWFGDQK